MTKALTPKPRKPAAKKAKAEPRATFKGERKDFIVRLPVEMVKALDKAAGKGSVSRNDIVQGAVGDWLDARSPKPRLVLAVDEEEAV